MSHDDTLKKGILITGGSGFVGRNLIRELFRARPDLTVYNYAIEPTGIDDVIEIIQDAREFTPESLANISFDYVVNLLALSHDTYCKDFETTELINVNFTRRLFDVCRARPKIRKIIHMSTFIIYDQSNQSPVAEDGKLNINYTTYTFTKGIAEQYANYYREKYHMPVIIFRLSNIYGPFQKYLDSPFLVPSKIVQGIREHRIEVLSTKPTRDWLYIGDAVRAVVKALDIDFSGILNLASGKPTSIGDIIGEIANTLHVPYVSLDKPTTGPISMYCDISKMTSILHWHPEVPIKEGVRKTVKHYQEKML